MAKVIVISGHPHLERSIMNKTILEELKKAAEGGASIAIDDIAEKGCCHLDVAAEQALLKEADTIVFQFPVYWFNAPAMLKHWFVGEQQAVQFASAHGGLVTRVGHQGAVVWPVQERQSGREGER